MQSELKQALGAAIRAYRLNREIPQESLGPSQPYISNLENGKWSATLEKVDRMAGALGVHPVSIILAGYLALEENSDTDAVLARIREELREIGH
ncbi:helix-turn-helix transcriptional regulator [Pseudomonas sp. PDM17]|uniref:helix-turn-helix domain-containing protein n=1 Tax=Pseudomonas sp. PDM17 TaxID=2769285 RepID=UPI00177AE88A|nr:helix-turn-helix transcriptional regulator [Pseudomonas sp. PDM17]MBD9503746.1 helix-turn-helix transcriptional regulator [Pseudomonas sp. PDM17]